MALEIMNAQQGSPDIFLVTDRVTDDVISMDRPPIAEQNRQTYGGQKSAGNPEIQQALPHPGGQSPVSTPVEGEDATNDRESARDSQQVSNGDKPVQNKEGANQSAPERPRAMKE